MTLPTNGTTTAEYIASEHDGEFNVALKKSGNYVWDVGAMQWVRMAGDASGNLQVDIVSGGSSGQQYADGDARGTATGTLAMGDDGTNIQSVHVDTAGDLQVDILTIPTVTVQATNLDIRDLSSASDSVSAAVTSIAAGTNAIGGITGAGSNAQIKDDSFYAEDVTSGILSVHNRLWDGAAYDRTPGDSTNGMLVNLGSNNDVSLNAGTNTIGKLADNSGVDIGDVTINNASGASAVNIQDGGNSITIDGNNGLAAPSAIGTGRKTVTIPGTAEAFGSSTTVKRVIAQAITDNTDIVYVGDSSALATDGSERGIGLYPGNSIELRATNLAVLFVDSRVASEGVTFYFENY